MNDRIRVRADLIAALTELGKRRPEWRLGQTIANVAMKAGRLDAGGVWELDDEAALAATQSLIAEAMEVESVSA